MSIPERIRYGAVELRGFYNRHLFAALGISISIHLALIALYLSSTDTVIAGSDSTVSTETTIIDLVDPTAPDKPEVDVVKSGPETGGPRTFVPPIEPAKGSGVARGGNPTPVDDLKLDSLASKFATQDQIASSTPNGTGNGGSPNGTENGSGGVPPQGGGEGDEGGTNATPKADEIPNEFPDPDVKLPDVNLDDITKRVAYPRLARENGIQGTVTVKVLIDEEGRPIRTSIEQGSNVLLDSAAIQAVRSTRFQPATLNGDPVKAWLFLPLHFTLD